jgi:hypothetical protein
MFQGFKIAMFLMFQSSGFEVLRNQSYRVWTFLNF